MNKYIVIVYNKYGPDEILGYYETFKEAQQAAQGTRRADIAVFVEDANNLELRSK